MWLGEVRIQTKCLEGRRSRLRDRVRGRVVLVRTVELGSQKKIAVGEARIVGIFLSRFFKKIDRSNEIRVRPLGPKETPPQIGLIGVAVGGAARGYLRLLFTSKRQSQSLGDLSRQIALNREKIIERVLVLLPPELCSLLGVDELRLHVQNFSLLNDAPCKHRSHPELSTYCLRIDVATVAKSRAPRHDRKLG